MCISVNSSRRRSLSIVGSISRDGDRYGCVECKNYHSSRKGWIAVLLLALIIVLLVGLWFRNEDGNTYTFPRNLSRIAYGVNVDISAMIAGSGYTVRAANGGDFFDLAAQLGINK